MFTNGGLNTSTIQTMLTCVFVLASSVTLKPMRTKSNDVLTIKTSHARLTTLYK